MICFGNFPFAENTRVLRLFVFSGVGGKMGLGDKIGGLMSWFFYLRGGRYDCQAIQGS